MRREVFRTAEGERIIADVGGPPEAPCVVFAHGGGQTRHAWSRAARAAVDAGYRVINYDARGHGDSDWAADNAYPARRRWEDMALVLAAAGPRAAIVGASMGGGSALFGVSCGARPTALVLVDIAPNAARAGMAHVRDFMASGLPGYGSLEEAADAVAQYLPHRTRPTDLGGLKKNLRLGADGRWRWHWDPGMLNLDIDEERLILARSLSALAASPSLPLLLVRGLQSDVVTDATVAEFRAAAPFIEVVDIGGAGHMVAGDRNDVFNAAVIEFLQRKMPVGASA